MRGEGTTFSSAVINRCMLIFDICPFRRHFGNVYLAIVVSSMFTGFRIIIISIQPEGRLWQEPEPSQATGMALAHCILGSFLGVGCHCFPPLLDVPAFASRCLHVQVT